MSINPVELSYPISDQPKQKTAYMDSLEKAREAPYKRSSGLRFLARIFDIYFESSKGEPVLKR
jgi:hypothetical protein